MKWKNINDKKPLDGERVLVCDTYYKRVIIATYNENNESWDSDDDDDLCYKLSRCPYWVELPKYNEGWVINKNTVQETLNDFKKEVINDVFKEVIESFEIVFDVDFNSIATLDKVESIDYRVIFCHYCREMGYRLVDIGRRVARDHSTVSYYLKKYDDLYKFDAGFRNKADRFGDILKNKELI